ncbi:MAG: hypothetical protein ABW168_08245 [Sedimenticola sp.]
MKNLIQYQRLAQAFLAITSVLLISGCNSITVRPAQQSPATVEETDQTISMRLDQLYLVDASTYFSTLRNHIEGETAGIDSHHYIRALEEYNKYEFEHLWMKSAWLYLNTKRGGESRLDGENDRKLLNFYAHKAVGHISHEYSEKLDQLCKNLHQEETCSHIQ